MSLIACLSAAALPAGEWALRDWQFRRQVEITTPARVCHVRFAHFGAAAGDGRDIRVTDSAGKIVNHELLRLGPGDQAEVLFECAAAKPGQLYAVYFGNKAATPPKAWTAPAGVVLEIRKQAPGSCKSWNDYHKMFQDSKEIAGRTLRTKIFDGYNPLGRNDHFLSYYRAYLDAPAAGQYKFATNSDDASFVFVDGTKVAEYPGIHGADARFGQHGGSINLSAGSHKIEYYHFQLQDEMAAMLAWLRPGEAHFHLVPETAFVPVGSARAKAVERSDGKPMLDFSWTPSDHLLVHGRYMVRYAFESSGGAETLNWDFGDGTKGALNTKEGLVLKHGFLAPGTYKVSLSAGKDASPAPVMQTVVVEPVWAQREEFDDKRWSDYRKAILARLESGAARPEDLAGVLTYAERLRDKELLVALAPLMWKLAEKMPATDRGDAFLTLGLQLQSQARDYEQADRALQEAIRATGDKGASERAKLHRAGMLIHIFGKSQEALDLLQGTEDKFLLAPQEPILRQMYFADACAAAGQREEAVNRYAALRTAAPLTDRKYAIGRRGRMLSIQAWIRSGDYESALAELRNIEWETPQERMADDTGILRAQCYLAQKDFQLAVVLLNRLLKVVPDSPRSPELLFLLLKAYRGMNRKDLAEDTFTRMKKEQPYAAETALAANFMSQ